MKKINFILPSFPLRPGGGHKIMYEYANRLAKEGYDICIYHVFTILNVKYKLHWLKRIYIHLFYPKSVPAWFSFEKNVKCQHVELLTDENIRDADVSVSTMWATAVDMSKLSKNKGLKINLIQDYETWLGTEQQVHDSYKLPMKHVVISDYLADIVENVTSKRPEVLYNAIDKTAFYIKNDIDDRNPYSVAMLYSTEERKGTEFGMAALRECKKIVPELSVELFGVYPKPKGLEDWIHYTQKPNDLMGLYNSVAIYFTPSNKEGWALPPAEALSCGCALVCTNIGGHEAYAKNQETALMVEPRNVEDMVEKLSKLLKNNEYRITLAHKGNMHVQNFTWEVAVNKMKNIMNI